MNEVSFRRRLGPALICILALSSCSGGLGLLDPAGPVAAGEKVILLNSLGIMLAIVVPTIAVTLAFAWWFRAGNAKAEYRPDWSYSGKLELLVWSVPMLVIVFLGGIAWIGSHTLDPSKPLVSATKPVVVEVVALDWKWLFIYPEQGIASVNRLVIPVGTPIAFRITSGTVMNSLFIPQLGSQIYAMAGMEAKLHLLADRAGHYEGLSAHYSGAGFADMRFAADAVPADRFAGWIAGAKAGGPALDGRAYLALAEKQGSIAPFTYARVRPGLFAAAVQQAGVPVAVGVRDGRQR